MPAASRLLLNPPLTAKWGDTAIGAGKAQSHQIGMKLLQRSALFARPSGLGLQPAREFFGEASLLGRSGNVNVGSVVPALGYFAIVLRDRPVRRLISLTGGFLTQCQPTHDV